MGLNISGIAIDSNFNKNVAELSKQFGWNLEFDKEIVFEEASSNFIDSGIVNIYFTDKGTIIFLDNPYIINEKQTNGINALGFGISETAMAFVLNYYENGQILREKVTYNGEIMTQNGDELIIEKEENDTTKQILKIIEQLVGEKYWDINLGTRAFRYKFLNKNKVKSSVKEDNLSELSSSEHKLNKESKIINHEFIDQIKSIAKSPAKTKEDFIIKMGAIDVLEGNLDPELFVKKIGLRKTKKWWQFWKK